MSARQRSPVDDVKRSTLVGPSHGTTIIWVRPSATEVLLAVDSRVTHTFIANDRAVAEDYEALHSDDADKFRTFLNGKYHASLCGDAHRCHALIDHLEDYFGQRDIFLNNLITVGEVAMDYLKQHPFDSKMENEVIMFICSWVSEQKCYGIIVVRDTLDQPLIIRDSLFGSGSGAPLALDHLSECRQIDVNTLVHHMMRASLDDPYTGGYIRVRSFKVDGKVAEVYKEVLVNELFRSPELQKVAFAKENMLVIVRHADACILSPNDLASLLGRESFGRRVSRMDIRWLGSTSCFIVYLATLGSPDDCTHWFDWCDPGSPRGSVRFKSYKNFAKKSCLYGLTYASLDMLRGILGITSFDDLRTLGC